MVPPRELGVLDLRGYTALGAELPRVCWRGLRDMPARECGQGTQMALEGGSGEEPASV